MIGDGEPPVTGVIMRTRPLMPATCQDCDRTAMVRSYRKSSGKREDRPTWLCDDHECAGCGS